MTGSAVLAGIEELFGEVIDLEGITFSGSSVLGSDIPLDSKDMLRVLSRIEARYGMRFRPDQVLRLLTVSDLVSAVLDGATDDATSGGLS